MIYNQRNNANKSIPNGSVTQKGNDRSGWLIPLRSL